MGQGSCAWCIHTHSEAGSQLMLWSTVTYQGAWPRICVRNVVSIFTLQIEVKREYHAQVHYKKRDTARKSALYPSLQLRRYTQWVVRHVPPFRLGIITPGPYHRSCLVTTTPWSHHCSVQRPSHLGHTIPCLVTITPGSYHHCLESIIPGPAHRSVRLPLLDNAITHLQ